MCFETLSPDEVRSKYLAAEDKCKALQLLADLTGTTYTEVAEFLGVDIKKKRRNKLVGTNILELYHAGMSDAEIASRLNVTAAGVYDWRKRNKLPRVS